MKRLWIILSILIAAVCFCCCGKGKPDDSSIEEQQAAQTMSFAEASMSVELYESATLVVQNAGGKTLTWRSANPEKLTVDENGVVFAKMAGTVVVYVSDGESEDSCVVTIVNSGYIPLLKIDLPEAVTLLKGDTYMLNPYVTYNGVKYTNAEFSYTASGSVSVAENGEITANSVGTGVVTVSASWNGVQGENLTMEIEVSVIE